MNRVKVTVAGNELAKAIDEFKVVLEKVRATKHSAEVIEDRAVNALSIIVLLSYKSEQLRWLRAYSHQDGERNTQNVVNMKRALYNRLQSRRTGVPGEKTRWESKTTFRAK